VLLVLRVNSSLKVGAAKAAADCAAMVYRSRANPANMANTQQGKYQVANHINMMQRYGVK